MPRLLAVLLFAAAILLSSPAVAARTVAVLPLHKGAGPEAYDGLGTALAGMLVSDLSQVQGLTLVERERLGDLLAEIELGTSDFIDPSTAGELGRGLGAELVLTGSYSVVGELFVMDTRLVTVEGGTVLGAARAEGPVAEFVAVEKQVVEVLLGRLQVELSMSTRRKLLIQTPTEDAQALASYGRGLDARDAGRLEDARQAFREAVERDPEFALASRALADLRTRTADAAVRERARAQDARTRSLLAALDQLPSERSRGPRFKDTVDSRIDLSIRLGLLARTGQHCAFYDELAHYLTRTGGTPPWIPDALPGADHRTRYAAAAERFDARGRALGLVGPGTPFGSRPGELVHQFGSILSSPTQILVHGSLQPAAFDHTLAAAGQRCFEPAARIGAWTEQIAQAERLGLLDGPLHAGADGTPVALTLRDAMELHLAWLLADHGGVDARVTARTDAVLARHAEGSSGRFQVLHAVQRVVQAGLGHERRQASRLGLEPTLLEAAAVSLSRADGAQLRLDEPACQGLVELSRAGATSAVQRLAQARDAGDPGAVEIALDNLGSAVAPALHARCFRSAQEPPADLDRVFADVRAGLDRVHPVALDDAACASRRQLVADNVTAARLETVRGWGEAAWPSQILSLYLQLHGLRTQLCLLP